MPAKFVVPFADGQRPFAAAGRRKCAKVAEMPNSNPPVAPKIPVITEIHGHILRDDYAWMREKDAPAVLDYLRAENAYTAEQMAHTAALEETLYNEMVARMKQTDLSVPVRDNGYVYYARTVEGLEYAIHCRKKWTSGADAQAAMPEETVLDLNAMREGREFVTVADMRVSDDTKLLGYLLDETGFREYTLCFKSLAGEEAPSERMEPVSSFEFATDNRTVLYVTDDDAKRPYRLWRHVLGTDPKTDVLVYEEEDERFTLGIDRTRDGEVLLLYAESHTTSEVRWVSAKDPTSELRLIAPRVVDREYSVDHRAGLFYVRVNDTGRNFRLVTMPVASTDPAHWKELVPHQGDVMLEDVDLFRDFCVLSTRKNAVEYLTVLPLDATSDVRDVREIPYDEPFHSMELGANPEFDTHVLRYGYTSYVTPASVLEYDVTSGATKVLKRQEVLGGYDASAYASEVTFARAADGTDVPVSLVYRKGMVRDGRAPLLLYGYGAYGIPLTGEFSSPRISLLDRGVTFAQAHIRGGGDLGKRWHDGGRMQQKMNSFTDFIACAEHLVREKYTSPDKLAARGGSAGGMLMGGVCTMRPDLFKCVIAEVPFVDVINTMLDESLPLTVGEFEEWGNPKELPAFNAIFAYSPYDNVKAQPYPALLVVSAYNDSQVMYWEPAKWVAKMRNAGAGVNAPILMKMELDPAGHGGKSGRYERLREHAFMYAFMLWQLGVTAHTDTPTR